MTTNGTQDPRWAQAEAMLHEGQDSSALPAGWGRRNGGYLVLAGLIVGLVLLCIAGAVAAARHGQHASHHTGHPVPIPVWRGTVAGALIAFGAILGALGMARMARTGLFGRLWNSTYSVLGHQQKIQLRNEVLGKVPLDPSHLPLARVLALRMTYLRGWTFVIIGILVMEFGADFTSFDPQGLVPVALFGVVVATNLLTTYRDSRLGQRFLDRHPAEGTNY